MRISLRVRLFYEFILVAPDLPLRSPNIVTLILHDFVRDKTYVGPAQLDCLVVETLDGILSLLRLLA